MWKLLLKRLWLMHIRFNQTPFFLQSSQLLFDNFKMLMTLSYYMFNFKSFFNVLVFVCTA